MAADPRGLHPRCWFGSALNMVAANAKLVLSYEVQAGVFGEISGRGIGETFDDGSDLMAKIADGASQAGQAVRPGQAQRSGKREAQRLVQQEFGDELGFEADAEIGAAADGAKMCGP